MTQIPKRKPKAAKRAPKRPARIPRVAIPDVIGRNEVSLALDILAYAIEATGNRKLLPIYERLERELAKFDEDDAVLERARKRAKRVRETPPELNSRLE